MSLPASDHPCIGSYLLLEPVSEGGQGTVWLARHRETGRAIALKMLHAERSRETERGRFRREAAILAALTDPGLPACLQLLENADGTPVALAMEYVKGITLKDVRKHRRLSPREVQAVARELTRVVGVLHGAGVVHRDLKPANIILRPGWESGIAGSVVVVDLGIAKGIARHATACTQPGCVVGSTAYLAPEYLLGQASYPEAAAKADVFAIGVVMWLLLFGKHPSGCPINSTLEPLMRAYLTGRLAEPRDDTLRAVQSAVPGLPAIVRRCVAFAPAERFFDAREVHLALLGLPSSPGKTVPCITDAPMAYNVPIHPRLAPSADMTSAPPARQLDIISIDVDFDATTIALEHAGRVPLEPTVDDPVVELLVGPSDIGPPSDWRPMPSPMPSSMPSPMPSPVPPASGMRWSAAAERAFAVYAPVPKESGAGFTLRTLLLVSIVAAVVPFLLLGGLLAYLAATGRIHFGGG